MTRHRTQLTLSLGVAALLAAPGLAHADASYNLRKAYTGNVGGNSNFGAGYRVEYGFSSSKANSSVAVGGDGQASTWVRLFGKTFDAVSVKTKATGSLGSSCSANVSYDTYLVGIKIPGRLASGSFAGGKVNQDIIKQDIDLTPKATVEFVNIGFASIGFDAFSKASARLNFSGTAWCNSVSVTLRPSVVLTGTLQFRFDARILAAGIRANLHLMNTALPITGNVGWSTKSEADFFSGGSFCTWTLGSSASVKLDFTPISGTFEPYVRVGLECFDIWGLLPGKGICLNKEFSQVIWSSSAGRTTYTLDGTPAEIRIGTNTSACPSIPAAPARSL